MTGRKTLLLVILVALIGLFMSLSFYYGILVVKIKHIPMDLKIEDRVGFFSDTDALHFGTVYAGGSSRRSVRISNNYDYPIRVIVKNEGNFSDWISLSNNGFIIEPNGFAHLNYTVNIPFDAEKSKYSGESIIIIRRSI